MWSDKPGKDSDIVILTRTAITRNIKGFPFCSKMIASDKDNVINLVSNAAESSDMKFLRLDQIGDEVRNDLYEKFMIAESTFFDGQNRGVLFNEEEGTNIIINCDEHIMVNCYANGSSIASTYEKAEAIACQLEKKLDIAYSDKYGFLTADIRNMGTGIKIYSVVSIPGIEKTSEAMATLVRRLGKYDWKISPFKLPSGEKASGIYILYNLATLGINEQELITRAKSVIEDVIKLERTCRINICKRKKNIVEDQYYRAFALLRYARRIENQEAFAHLNWIRLGFGNIEDTENINLSWKKINSLALRMLRNSKTAKKNGAVALSSTEENSSTIRSLLKGDE